MSEITGEALKEHNYHMGLQIGALIQAMGMHWENQRCLMANQEITYKEIDFFKVSSENSHVLTHNGILGEWKGIV